VSEACSSVGQLEARAGVGLALAPLPKNEREGGIAGCHDTVMRGYHEKILAFLPCVNGALRAGFVTASGLPVLNRMIVGHRAYLTDQTKR
jgi:hypothetical protein